MRVLVAFAHYAPTLSYFDDWLDAFRACAGAEVTTIDLCADQSLQHFEKCMHEHDAIVLLHSANADTMTYLAPFATALKSRRGQLATFVGNEVNLPGSPVAEKIDFFKDVQADWIFTQLPLEAGQWLYEECTDSKVAAIPHALQPQAFDVLVPDAERDIDIGVRTSRYTAYLGDNERNELTAYFEREENIGDLVVDISTTERFARDAWAGFLNRCRGTVSNEAGSWYLERDDATVDAIRAHVLETERARGGIVIAADSPFRRLGHRLPWRMRSLLRRAMRHGPVRHEAAVNEDVSFEEIQQRFFANREKAPAYSKCISSRHFDAIGTGTCQLMLRGRFNDILVADEHYMALDEDLSNADEVLRRFADPLERAKVVSAAKQHVLSNHTYAHRIEYVLSLLGGSG
jgi:hypothetical protein